GGLADGVAGFFQDLRKNVAVSVVVVGDQDAGGRRRKVVHTRQFPPRSAVPVTEPGATSLFRTSGIFLILGAAREGGNASARLCEPPARRTDELLVQSTYGPEQAAGYQFQIARVGDGFVVVAQRHGEDAGFAFVAVGPGDDKVVPGLVTFLVPRCLLAADQRPSRVEQPAGEIV